MMTPNSIPIDIEYILKPFDIEVLKSEEKKLTDQEIIELESLYF